ncbi:uncharacterized protein LOC141822067 isoform X1 [Curcuma longa]|uniref:uncharacterized protein LOC141822067 isoform X1 n=1 Tax=Curcuma longa TaxID=136217 RepID=UPI003D9E1B25
MQSALRRLALSSSQASSFSSSKSVSIGSSSASYQLSPISHGNSSAASVPSISCKSQRGKRISKEKRRALVESFVGKYRAQNAGIFPSIQKVKMEVGGSYYVIRELVQELEYNAKLASFNKVTRQPGKVEGSAQISDAAMSSAIVADEILKSSTMAKDEPSVVTEADALQIPPGELVGCQTEISTIDSSADIPNQKVVKHARSDTTLGTDMEDLQPIENIRSSNQGDSPRATSFWSNLRSLADGIFSFWKKK